jgi:hypothetical protein
MNAEVLDCVEDYARLLAVAGQLESAVRICAAAAAARKELGIARSLHRENDMQARIEAWKQELGERSFDAAWSIGRHWSRDEAIEHALSAVPPAVTA